MNIWDTNVQATDSEDAFHVTVSVWRDGECIAQATTLGWSKRPAGIAKVRAEVERISPGAKLQVDLLTLAEAEQVARGQVIEQLAKLAAGRPS